MTLASKYALPAIYGAKSFPLHGGLMSYGVDYTDVGRRMARYVDCILRGDDPDNLSVQQPNEVELVINLRRLTRLALVCLPLCLRKPMK